MWSHVRLLSQAGDADPPEEVTGSEDVRSLSVVDVDVVVLRFSCWVVLETLSSSNLHCKMFHDEDLITESFLLYND